VLKNNFDQQESKLDDMSAEITGLKKELNRYVENTSFNHYKDLQAS